MAVLGDYRAAFRCSQIQNSKFLLIKKENKLICFAVMLLIL